MFFFEEDFVKKNPSVDSHLVEITEKFCFKNLRKFVKFKNWSRNVFGSYRWRVILIFSEHEADLTRF